MKKEFNISIFTENQPGLLNRVTIVFTRRKINIESITASESEIEGVYRYTIVVNETEDQVQKVVKQIEKQVDVHKAFFHANDQIVYQEIALFKVATEILSIGGKAESIIRNHNARVVAVEPDFTILEKTGHKLDTQKLFDELKPFGILEFVRSGRVAISKPMKQLKDYLHEVEQASHNTI